MPLKDPRGKIIGTFGISRDITEWKQTIEELSKAKEKAEESDRLKTSFLQNISHEIRTPMNAILGFSELLPNPNLMPDKRKEYVNIICQSGKNLMNIIEDVLKISSVETGQDKVKLQKCNLRELMEMLRKHYEEKVEARNLGFRLEIPEGRDISFLTDTTKLNQILSNLLANALKFTRQGFIKLGCGVEGNALHFYVEDSGIGIPSQHLERIFERFYQVESYLSREYGGTGLGLSICKAYAEMLGGKIWAESEPGKGSVFHLLLPYNADEIKEEAKEGNSDKLLITKVKDALILLVEDDDYNYMLIREFLLKVPVRLHRVVTGREAIETCRKETRICLVLMDIKLPDIDGFEATMAIRQFNKNLPIVALTACAFQEDEEKAKAAGCSDYISKPVSREKLFSILRHYLT